MEVKEGVIYPRTINERAYEEVMFRPKSSYELQAYVNKYIYEGWGVETLSPPVDGYDGHVRFLREVKQERIDD